jgi:phosphoesterase RecJ-like protein
MSLKRTISCIKNNKRFLITTHTNPEGDALGSELAFYKLLRSLGKNAVIINEDKVPYEYNFLPAIDNIKKFKNNLRDIEFDCFVIVDCSDLKRCGEVYRLNRFGKPVINIDHHISNGMFADINWVEPHASSCTQMIYKLFQIMRIKLDKDTAMFLYVGLLTDTGSFRYSNTTSLTHRIAAQLLRYNLDVPLIYKNIYGNIPFQDMKLLTTILPTLRQKANGKIVWFQICRNMLEHKKIIFDLSENILNFGRSIGDAEVVVLFKENLGTKNEIRVNLRSQGKVDVNKIASYFGGGGHKTAASCTVIGNIDEVRTKVLKKIEKTL